MQVCLQGNGMSSSVWMDEQLAWYRSTLDRAKTDETCGADFGLLGTVDVRRQTFGHWSSAKTGKRGAGRRTHRYVDKKEANATGDRLFVKC